MTKHNFTNSQIVVLAAFRANTLRTSMSNEEAYCKAIEEIDESLDGDGAFLEDLETKFLDALAGKEGHSHYFGRS